MEMQKQEDILQFSISEVDNVDKKITIMSGGKLI